MGKKAERPRYKRPVTRFVFCSYYCFVKVSYLSKQIIYANLLAQKKKLFLFYISTKFLEIHKSEILKHFVKYNTSLWSLLVITFLPTKKKLEINVGKSRLQTSEQNFFESGLRWAPMDNFFNLE